MAGLMGANLADANIEGAAIHCVRISPDTWLVRVSGKPKCTCIDHGLANQSTNSFHMFMCWHMNI